MARLSKHGKELFRYSQDRETPDSDTTISRRTTTAIMEDGAILRKEDVRFRPSASWDPPSGRAHCYGWKLHGKVKDGRIKDYLEALREKARATDSVRIETDMVDSLKSAHEMRYPLLS